MSPDYLRSCSRYWDHVGGDQLVGRHICLRCTDNCLACDEDAALENMNQDGVIVICGLIAGYNGQQQQIKVRSRIQGADNKSSQN